MTHGSLFSGIGGFDLAAHWAGIENIFACEIDEFCRKVLTKRFPKTILFNDIKETNFAQFNGRVDIISGGFPCQPFSVAGKRAGTKDNRYLWREMLRVVREIKPCWVIAENVRGLLSINDGDTFETVCDDLEVSGYEVQPFIIPALSVGAPHKRERLWIVAHTTGERSEGGLWGESNNRTVHNRGKNWSEKWSQALARIYGMDDGLPGGMDGLEQRYKDRSRKFRIKAMGNSIVPQIAHLIFKTILEAEREYYA